MPIRNSTLEQARFLIFQKVVARARFMMHCMRKDSVLQQFMTNDERLSQKGNELLFNKSDEHLYLRDMGTEQVQRFVNHMEADVSRLIWTAVNQGGIPRAAIAEACNKELDWVGRQMDWHDRYLRVLRASILLPAIRNEVTAIAWAIANN